MLETDQQPISKRQVKLIMVPVYGVLWIIKTDEEFLSLCTVKKTSPNYT